VPVPEQKSTAEAIIEFRRIGNAVKVSATDTVSLLEVSIIAPASSTEQQMTDAVMRKLHYMLARRKAEP
jgi:hypothetical protein